MSWSWKQGVTTVIAVAALAAGATAARADRSTLSGGYFTGGFPIGDWGKIAGFGLGMDEATIVHPDANKPLAVRGSLGLHYNFSRTTDVPSANLGANDKLELETKNWSLFFGLGPELAVTHGDVRPFVFGTVGFDTYWTSSNLSGTVGGLPYDAAHGDSRLGFAWSGGLGARRKVSAGVMGELSVEYRSGSGHEYLQPDQITASGASVNAKRDARTTNQIIVRVGTLFGM